MFVAFVFYVNSNQKGSGEFHRCDPTLAFGLSPYLSLRSVSLSVAHGLDISGFKGKNVTVSEKNETDLLLVHHVYMFLPAQITFLDFTGNFRRTILTAHLPVKGFR